MGQRPETREGHTTDSEDHSMHIESSRHSHDSTTGVGGVHIFIEGECEGEAGAQIRTRAQYQVTYKTNSIMDMNESFS